MLSHISWAVYWSITAALIAGWYLYLGATSFRNEISTYFTGRKKSSNDPGGNIFSAAGVSEKTAVAEPPATFTLSQEPSYDDIDELIERVKGATVEAVEQEFTKDQLFHSLQKIVKDYHVLANSPYRPSVNEFIITECAEQAGIQLNETEADSLWN